MVTMKKGQIFTIDTVIGIIIVISLLTTAYGFSSYYLTLNALSSSSNNIVAAVSSAAFAFTVFNTTHLNIDKLQNGVININNISKYVSSNLGSELIIPYSVTIFAKENYSSNTSSLVDIFNKSYTGFNPHSSFISIPQVLVISNFSSLCGAGCSSNLSIESVFPTQSAVLSATNCTVSKNNGAPVAGWTIQNDTPSGSCTITAGNYSAAPPNNYLVNAFSSSGGFVGNTTLYVMSLDLVSIDAQS